MKKVTTMLVIGALIQVVLLSAAVSTLIWLASTAYAQDRGSRCSPTEGNPQGHFCGNPHDIGGPPVRSCNSPNALTSPDSACRFNPNHQ
jgi:hypothetical protein